MSRSMDKHRMVNRDLVYGEAGSEQAKTYSNLLSALAQAGGEIASTQLKSKEDAAANKEKVAAQNAAKEARKKASMAAADALKEQNPNGPLHAAAQKADNDAKVAEAKAAYYDSMSAPSAQPGAKPGSSAPSAGVPSWVWYAVAGVGVVGLGYVGYRLVSKK